MSAKVFALAVAAACAWPHLALAHPAPAPGTGARVAPHQCVVLLHGMGRTRQYMSAIEEDLEQAGYDVVNVSYPSRQHPIEELAPRVAGFVQRCRALGATRNHFVTHSLGGIVARYWLKDHPLPEGGRLVMLGPPNRGSEVTDHYRNRWWYRFSTGPAGQQIGTDADSIPNRLGAPPLETGVIAGTREGNPAFNALFGGPNDGKVSVARARIPGLADFLQVDASHYYLTHSAVVLHQVRAFLATGRFEHGT
jgi:pimeloyl-ACP methyl ester carboxylesterase